MFVSLNAGAQIPPDSLWRVVQKIHFSQSDSAKTLAENWLKANAGKNDFANNSHAHYWLGSIFMKKNLDSAQAHAIQCLLNAEKSEQPVLMARAHFLQGSVSNRNSKFDVAINQMKTGLEVLIPEKDTATKRYNEIYELLLRGLSTAYN